MLICRLASSVRKLARTFYALLWRRLCDNWIVFWKDRDAEFQCPHPFGRKGRRDKNKAGGARRTVIDAFLI
ncbi:hypothetical protein EMIT043CA1_100127 [Pseudomonas brassicacearum]